MKTVLVTGFTDTKTRVAAVGNIACLLARRSDRGGAERVCLTSTVHNAFELDLLLWDEDDKKVGASRVRPGILDLIAEYQDTLLTAAWSTNDRVSDPEACDYGTTRLRRPSSILQELEPAGEGDLPVHLLRGGPRKFSNDEANATEDPRVDWRDLWTNCAGAAFFDHIVADLSQDHDWFIVDCDSVVDRDLVLLLAPLVDAVLLLSDYSEGSKAEANHLVRSLRPSGETRPVILPCPAAVRSDEMEILELQRKHFNRHFGSFAPKELDGSWFVQAELPYVSYYMSRSLLLCRQSTWRLHVPLYSAYLFVAETLRTLEIAPSSPATALAERLADASRRAKWDVFISYSSTNQEMAVALRDWLRKSELRAFLSQSDLTFEIGSRKWLDAINSVLERSGVLVLIATEEACRSEWVRHELTEFEKYGRLIVPLRVGEHALPATLSAYHLVPWNGNTASLDSLKEMLRLILGGLSAVSSRTAGTA